ncbi:MAG TPA: lysylphosphatidylglycerol synthase transmembrane domain-containing protein [Rickettsiales bacterium]|nr:lysylphosphatidylglycerol synthase transmembrane domain-containing protein [Rickettsiales bacterium]
MTSKTKSVAKYVLALLLLALILYKTDIEKIGSYMRHISTLHLLGALLCMTIAQLISALRTRYFFQRSGYHLSHKFAVILFYVGTFYNFLLPGGIGGDAYKVMLSRKRFDMPTAKGIQIMVADRASGLCILLLFMYASLWGYNWTSAIPYHKPLLIAAAALTLIGYTALSWILLKQPAKTMLVSLHYSFSAQVFWVLTVWMLWRSLGNGHGFIDYATLYCAASVAAMIPISVGGLGIKESAYYYGATLLRHYTESSADGELGISLSLCFFALSFIACLPGVLWLHKIGRPEFAHSTGSPSARSS